MARSYLIYGTKSKQFFPHLQPTQQKTQKIWNLRILRSYRIFWQRKYFLFRIMFCTSIADNYGLMQFCCDVSKMRGFVVIELKNFAECVMILCSFLFSAFVHQNKCHKIFEDYPLMFSPLQLPGPCCNISLSAESEDRLCDSVNTAQSDRSAAFYPGMGTSDPLQRCRPDGNRVISL